MAWADAHGLAARLQLTNVWTGSPPHSPDRLPLVICGPVLRRTEPEAVTVWVALKRPATATLRVYSQPTPPATTPLREELQGTRETVRLGEHLHVVAVTARPVEAGRLLAPGAVYFYNLFFAAAGGSPVPESGSALNDDDIVFLKDSAPDGPQPTGLSYSPVHRLPSFSLPPADLNKLRILHGTCRKPDGPGRDAMPVIDQIISDAWSLADERPHLLMLNGDQIYADDVSDTVLFLLMDADAALLGWSETLPGVSQDDVRLRPGKRKGIVRGDAKLTTEDPAGHLLRMGEYFAMYLFSWSGALWPTEFPEFAEVKNKPVPVPHTGEEQLIKEGMLRPFRREVEALKDFQKSLREVRRVLANVPVYMMFDDHDVTDDWNMLREWCERIYANRLARRVVQNALVGYAVFQAWGNTPERFEAGQAGAALLAAVAAWSQAGGNDAAQAREIERRVGIPGTLSVDGQLPPDLFEHVGDFFRLKPDPGALRWDYTVRAPNLEILMLDSRTRREFTEDKAAPPAHLGPAALAEQIPLDDLDPNKLFLVVASTNVITVPLFNTRHIFGDRWILAWWYFVVFLLTSALRFAISRRLGSFSLFNPDLNDSWQPQTRATEALLSRLGRRGAVGSNGTRTTRALLLSGDVHFSWAARMQYWADHPFDAPPAAEPVEAIFAHLTSSAFKKEEPLLGYFHVWGYIPASDSMPAPLKWLGWKEPSALGVSPHDVVRMSDWVHMEDWMQHRRPPMLALRDAQTTTAFVPPPDWRYRVDYTLGEKSGVDFTLGLLEKPNPSDHENWLKVFNEAHKRYKNYARKWGDGIEMVGRNNVAELRVQWGGQTTLASGVNVSDTSFTVAAPGALPAPPVLVRVGSEIVRVGAIDRGTGVCSKLARAQHTTQATAHAAGAAVEVFKTATQMHWWRLTGDTKLTPLTRFTISLDYLDPQFPKPKRPGEV